MAFPLTHLCVAWRILEINPLPEKDAAQFLLGSISPDAIHYRAEFQDAAKSNIGAAKKITHLCPVSCERWGQVTDNVGWVNCVKAFLAENPDSFAAGYATHVLTDIHNNRTIWERFRTNHPAEAAKGYTSGYYEDLKNIDTRLYRHLALKWAEASRKIGGLKPFFGVAEAQFQSKSLYQEFPANAQIFSLLEKAEPADMPGLVHANEVDEIRQSLLQEWNKHTANLPAPPQNYSFVTWEDTLNFIQEAAEFCIRLLA